MLNVEADGVTCHTGCVCFQLQQLLSVLGAAAGVYFGGRRLCMLDNGCICFAAQLLLVEGVQVGLRLATLAVSVQHLPVG